ncbi:threonine--tRNA ligase [Flavobacterium sp.]|jgi:threonyl-tRNA synthetase|uniref:threonine--tRNA ligase n=1 Tax=Flavobacterium sp. TaxID=239 RepID=UPI0037BFD5F6
MTNIILPNGEERFLTKESINLIDVAASISNSLAKEALVASINDSIVDSNFSIPTNSTVNLFTWKDDEGKNAFWHTSAHLLGAAILELYPSAKIATGPAIENGFYYDVDFENIKFTDADLKKVEDKMLLLAKQSFENVRIEVSKKDALVFFETNYNPYKLELINDLQDGTITFYQTGRFTDLCAGPHIPNTSFIKAIKLTAISGAYWRANDNNKMLTRIYGISFPKKTDLDTYLEAIEKAKKNDHRKLGKELDLFYFDEEVGMGLPLWAPKGEALRQNLIGFLRKIQSRAGYKHVASPHIGKKELYITSGHYAKYGEDSFQPIYTPAEDEAFFLKPMNCPHHCKIYSATPKSYKELPIKYAEFGTVYRYEQSGELHGLTRVRGFTQDDAHIFCRPDQLKEEFLKVVDLVNLVYSKLGFTGFNTQISLRDPSNKQKYLGTDEMWELAENAIIEATQEKGIKTTAKEGEAAFYGPKLDFMVRDAIGRKWQIGTIQVDYMMPENFDLTYIGNDNAKHRPVMIHRALFGSMERFIALLIENTGCNFPLWLAPTKIVVLPIATKYNDYCENLANKINEHFDLQIEVDTREEKIGRKIRDAETQKIPFMFVVGEQEMNSNSVSIREHGVGDIGTLILNEVMQLITEKLKV